MADNNNLRLTEVAVTKEYSGGVPVWTNAVIYTVPEGASAFSFAAFGDTQYAVRRRTQDVFGQYSAWSSYAEHTTLSGADSLTTSALDHEITETEIADDSISTPKLQANSVTAGKLLVGYNGSGNLLADGDFSWYGIGDTQYWTPGTDWSVIAASGTSIYEHGRWRCRFNGTAIASAAYMTSLQPIRMADHHVFSLALLHRVESMSAGTLRVQVLEYTNAGALVATNTLQTYTTTTDMDVDGWVIAGNAYVAPAGVTVDLTLDSTTDYVIIQFGADSGTTASWYILSASCTPGYLPTLSANTGSYYSAVDIGAGGIIIYNGKLIFQDEFGATALDGYGFGGSWVKFIHNGVYNGDFAAGSTSDIAVSETGSGSGLANYKASISQDLPSWVVAASDGTVKLVSDSTATGGYSLQMQQAASQTNRIYQDIPVVPGMWPLIQYEWRYTAPTSEDFTPSQYFSYRDSDHAIIGSRLGGGILTGPGTTVYTGEMEAIDVGLILGEAPKNAAFVRIEFEVAGGTGTTEVYFNEVRSTYGNPTLRSVHILSDTSVGLAEDPDIPLVVGDKAGDNLAFDGNSIQARYTTDLDSTLSLNAAGGGLNVGNQGTLDPITLRGTVNITDTSDTSLSDSTPALMIGSVSGSNLAMDANEIIARNNGSASNLNLQTDGGILTVNNNNAPTTTADGILIGGDIQLYRTAANQLTLAAGDAFRRDWLACHAIRSSNQSLANNAHTAVQFNAADVYDWGAWHSTSTNNTRITPTIPGYYRITASAHITYASPNRIMRFLMDLWVSGSAYTIGGVGGSGQVMDADNYVSGGGGTTDHHINGSWVTYLNGTTDYVELYVSQVNTGSTSLNLSAAELIAEYVGQ